MKKNTETKSAPKKNNAHDVEPKATPTKKEPLTSAELEEVTGGAAGKEPTPWVEC